MIAALLNRPQAWGVTHLITTVTADNRSSRAMFEGLARTWATALVEEPLFDSETHFAGAHATEWQLRIGPIPASGLAQARNHADQEV